MWRIILIVLFIAGIIAWLWLMTGCAWDGIVFEGCILCDAVPVSGAGVVAPVHVSASAPVPAPRFYGTAAVDVGRGLHGIQGDIFQALQSCGITRVDVADERYWAWAAPVPWHDYRVDVSATSSWQYGVSEVSVTMSVSRAVPIVPGRREYRFLANGTGIAYYGTRYDSSGRPYHTGVFRSYTDAARAAAYAAAANLCGHAPTGGVAAPASALPRENSMACHPPTCYEQEQSIWLYGTWGGGGVSTGGVPLSPTGQKIDSWGNIVPVWQDDSPSHKRHHRRKKRR
jgi:hypothetical protein